MKMQQMTRDYIMARSRLDKAKIEVSTAERCLVTAKEELGQAEQAHTRLADAMIAITQRQADERVSHVIDTAQAARDHADAEVEELRERLARLERIATVARATRQPHTHAQDTYQADCRRCRAEHDLGVALMVLEQGGASADLEEPAKGRELEVPTLDLAHADDGGNQAGG
jgi:hypothetical protein